MALDEELLKRLRNNQTAALDEIVVKYTPYLFTVLVNQLRGNAANEDIEELSANVFFSLWEHRQKLRTDNLRSWLGAVARNEARSLLRKKKLNTVELEDYISVTGDNAHQLTEEKERQKYLQRALDTLDEETREIFIRHFFYGQTVVKVSEEMRMNQATVKSRLQRGRRKLKDELIKGGYTCED